MPQGDKSSYSDKQKRQAKHIADSYKKRGSGGKSASKRAWATVNKMTGGGKKSGSGRGKAVNKGPAKKGGKKGGARVSGRPGASLPPKQSGTPAPGAFPGLGAGAGPGVDPGLGGGQLPKGLEGFDISKLKLPPR